jgi:hypothetical protein
MDFIVSDAEERTVGEFRRKVRSAEVLSAAMEKLLSAIHFNGPGQHRGAEWPRAEIRLRGGLLPKSRWPLRLRKAWGFALQEERKSLALLTK